MWSSGDFLSQFSINAEIDKTELSLQTKAYIPLNEFGLEIIFSSVTRPRAS